MLLTKSVPKQFFRSTIVSSAAQQYMTHLAKMYMDGQTADVQFVIKSAGCADEIIPAHKILLVATSAVFRTMFYGSVPETGNVTITDTTSNAFKKFLEWFYYSNPVITMQTIEGVLYLAHKYDVESCFNACSTFLIDNMDKDILLAYNLGNKYDLSNVKEKCQSMFDASSAYYTSKPYLECSQDTFEKIVQFPFIPAKRKFELCMTWSENGCKRLKQDPKHMTYRRALLRNCIDHIDFNAMSPNEFHDCIEQSFGLFSYSKMQRLLLGFAKKHM